MYSFPTMVDGVAYTVYFFATFSGHFHPYTPVDPLEFDEIHIGLDKYDSVPYYQGWYSETETGPRLDRLIKNWLIRKPFNGDFTRSTAPGVYYHRLEKVEGEWLAKELIAPDVVLKQEHYLRYVINNDGDLEYCHHIYSTFKYKYIYTYNKSILSNVERISNVVPEDIPDL